MKSSIVLGLGFGDEGKGRVTSYLCSLTHRPVVVRFNGGHQAGHTVMHNGTRHVFSNFGSGTLQNVPTYWSRFCTVYPTAIRNEYQLLRQYKPKLYIHPLCPVTTPFDLLHNQFRESFNQHGSCGVGFGSTINRQESYYKLYFQDLFFPSVLKEKLYNIAAYYGELTSNDMEARMNLFMEDVQFLKDIVEPSFSPHHYDHFVFEGAQGILLDMDFGFFPNVTRSNTTCKNVFPILKDLGITHPPSIYYVTRSYQTRHGNGFMSNEKSGVRLINNESETNVKNEWQGNFRTGVLDIDMINYALTCDSHFSQGLSKKLVVTCVDQTGEEIDYSFGGVVWRSNIMSAVKVHVPLPFDELFYSMSDHGDMQGMYHIDDVDEGILPVQNFPKLPQRFA